MKSEPMQEIMHCSAQGGQQTYLIVIVYIPMKADDALMNFF